MALRGKQVSCAAANHGAVPTCRHTPWCGRARANPAHRDGERATSHAPRTLDPDAHAGGPIPAHAGRMIRMFAARTRRGNAAASNRATQGTSHRRSCASGSPLPRQCCGFLCRRRWRHGWHPTPRSRRCRCTARAWCLPRRRIQSLQRETALRPTGSEPGEASVRSIPATAETGLSGERLGRALRCYSRQTEARAKSGVRAGQASRRRSGQELCATWYRWHGRGGGPCQHRQSPVQRGTVRFGVSNELADGRPEQCSGGPAVRPGCGRHRTVAVTATQPRRRA